MKRGLIFLIPIFLILLAYKAIFLFGGYLPEQMEVMDYLREERGLGEGYSQGEIGHLKDVKGVMMGLDIFFYLIFAIIMVIITLLFIRQEGFGREFMWGGIVTVGVVGLLFLLVSLIFDWLFGVFHRVLFTDKSWVFDIGSRLTTLFPKEFFINFVREIIVLSVIFGVIVGAIGGIVQYYRPKKYRKQTKSLNKS